MNRSQLEHAIRSACAVSEDPEVYIIGSQAILGQYPDAPESLLVSMEADAIPKNKPETWNWIDGALGELSIFHKTHGFYVQGLDLTTAKLSDGWEERCIIVDAGDDARGLCLEGHDLALSKLAAFREKDLDFVRTLLVEDMVQRDPLLERLNTLPIEEEHADHVASWIRRLADELEDPASR